MGNLFKVYIILILISTFIVFPDIITEEAKATNTPYVSIGFSAGKDEQKAEVGPDDDGLVKFSGIVNVSSPLSTNVSYINVTLKGSTTQNWPVSISPPFIHVKPFEDAVFIAKVSVPLRTHHHLSSFITISGIAKCVPGNSTQEIDEIKGLISIAQFSQWTINCSDMDKTIIPGKEDVYKINITNTGNGRDTLTLYISNYYSLKEQGISIELSADTLELDQGESNVVELTLNIPEDIEKGDYYIILEASTEAEYLIEGQQSSRQLILKASVKESPGSIFSDFALIAGLILVFVLLFALVIYKKRIS